MYFNSPSVPLTIVPCATLGTRAVGCRRLVYTMMHGQKNIKLRVV